MKFFIELKYEIDRMWRMFDFWQWLAGKLPRKLCYYAFIRVYANATSGMYGNDYVGDVSWDVALKRWEPQNGE